MGGMLVSCMRNFSIPPDAFTRPLCQVLPAGLGDRYILRQQVRLWYSTAAPYSRIGRVCTPCSGRGCDDEYPKVARRLNVDHKTVWSILHNQHLHPYHPREYRQCDQRILCHESTSADGSCTVVLMSPTFHGGSSPLMKPSLSGKVL